MGGGERKNNNNKKPITFYILPQPTLFNWLWLAETRLLLNMRQFHTATAFQQSSQNQILGSTAHSAFRTAKHNFRSVRLTNFWFRLKTAAVTCTACSHETVKWITSTKQHCQYLRQHPWVLQQIERLRRPQSGTAQAWSGLASWHEGFSLKKQMAQLWLLFSSPFSETVLIWGHCLFQWLILNIQWLRFGSPFS